jgi:uncharacterized protein YndB with AHSA1/START domain
MENILVVQTYPYSIEQVWEALTDPTALADWLMPGDFKPVVGHKLQFRCGEPHPEFDGSIDVQVLETNKPNRLSYSWKTKNMPKPSTVTFILTSTRDGGTHLRLEHSGLEGDSGKLMHPLFKGGWELKLGSQLGLVLARRDQRGTRS